jgi:hypothetical protein
MTGTTRAVERNHAPVDISPSRVDHHRHPAVEALEAIDPAPLATVRQGEVGADAVVSGWLDALYGEGLQLAYLSGVATSRGSGRSKSAEEWHRDGLSAHESKAILRRRPSRCATRSRSNAQPSG